MSLLLADQTWVDLQQRKPLVVVPLGSCEQHGPHLPVDTDAAIASCVAWRVVQQLAASTDVLLAPAQTYAASGEHEGFAGTVSIGCEALETLLVELGRSLSRWAGRVLIVNGHGGNTEVLASAVGTLRSERRAVAWWSCVSEAGDAHAGRTETGAMMALRPLTVRSERAVAGRTEPIEQLMPALRASSVRRVSTNGVLGNPKGASASEGERLLANLVERLRIEVRSWRVTPTGKLAKREVKVAS